MAAFFSLSSIQPVREKQKTGVLQCKICDWLRQRLAGKSGTRKNWEKVF